MRTNESSRAVMGPWSLISNHEWSWCQSTILISTALPPLVYYSLIGLKCRNVVKHFSFLSQFPLSFKFLVINSPVNKNANKRHKPATVFNTYLANTGTSWRWLRTNISTFPITSPSQFQLEQGPPSCQQILLFVCSQTMLDAE